MSSTLGLSLVFMGFLPDSGFWGKFFEALFLEGSSNTIGD